MDRQAKILISAMLAAFGTASGIPQTAIAAVLAQSIRAAASEAPIDAETEAQILLALGWVFFPAMPKSARAHPNNYAHQTTWWKPFWFNFTTHRVSYTQPSAMNGYWGDHLPCRASQHRWRAGGPPYPRRLTAVEVLCAYSEKQGLLRLA